MKKLFSAVKTRLGGFKIRDMKNGGSGLLIFVDTSPSASEIQEERKESDEDRSEKSEYSEVTQSEKTQSEITLTEKTEQSEHAERVTLEQTEQIICSEPSLRSRRFTIDTNVMNVQAQECTFDRRKRSLGSTTTAQVAYSLATVNIPPFSPTRLPSSVAWGVLLRMLVLSSCVRFLASAWLIATLPHEASLVRFLCLFVCYLSGLSVYFYLYCYWHEFRHGNFEGGRNFVAIATGTEVLTWGGLSLGSFFQTMAVGLQGST